MAPTDHYYGTAGDQGLHNQNTYPQPHAKYPSSPPPPHSNSQFQTYNNTSPPTFSPHSQGQQQLQYRDGYFIYYPSHAPAQGHQTNGHTPDRAAYAQPATQLPHCSNTQNGFLGAPLQLQRSRSQPAHVRFADDASDSSRALDYSSDSSPSRHRHHHHRHHHSHRLPIRSSGSRSRSTTRGLENKRDHGGGDRSQRIHHQERRDRDTFLGAGAGSIVGDLLFPGLGTAAGLLIGGYGGRKYAKKQSREEMRER